MVPLPCGDGVVNVQDLLAVINAWGNCPSPPTTCPADIAPSGGDGVVNVQDMLAVIDNWGSHCLASGLTEGSPPENVEECMCKVCEGLEGQAYYDCMQACLCAIGWAPCE